MGAGGFHAARPGAETEATPREVATSPVHSAPHTPTPISHSLHLQGHPLPKHRACPCEPSGVEIPAQPHQPLPPLQEPRLDAWDPMARKAACVSRPGERSVGSGHVRVAEVLGRGQPAGGGPGNREQQAFAVGVYLCSKCSGAPARPWLGAGARPKAAPHLQIRVPGPQRADPEHRRRSGPPGLGRGWFSTAEAVPGPGAGGAGRVVTEDPDCGQGPSLENKGASAEGSGQWDPPGDQSQASRRWAGAGEARTQEDRQTDGPARAAESRGSGRASLLPLAGSQLPQPWDPRGGQMSGLQGGGDAHPGHGQWVEPVEPKSFPRPHRPFPSPASGVNPPATPHTPASAQSLERQRRLSRCHSPGGQGGGTPPFLSCRRRVACRESTGLHHQARGWWAQARLKGQRGSSVRVQGKVGRPHGARSGGPVVQGLLDTRGPGGRAGVWANTRRGSRWAISPHPGPPVGHRGLQAAAKGPLPSTGGAGGMGLTEAGVRECDLLPGAHAAAEIRHKIISEQSV